MLHKQIEGILTDSELVSKIEHVHISDFAGYFREFFATAKDCRFGNCTHTNEPGCAVQEALVRGDIAISRYESYLSLLGDCTESKYR